MSSTFANRIVLLMTLGVTLGVAGGWTMSVALDRPIGEALALMIPLTIIFMFLSLPIENSCRATELSASALPRLVGTHLLGALLTAGIWTLVAIGLARIHLELAGVIWTARAYRLIFVEGLILYLLAAAAHYLAIEIRRTAGAQQRAIEARASAHEAELRALRFQINPHFLFNSLNSISSLCGTDPKAARDMTNRLAMFFRSSLSAAAGNEITLERELETVRQYLEIEKIRFGERLEVRIECPEDLEDVGVPPLILQPLVENAIKHGAATIVGQASIAISCETSGNGHAVIRVVNDTDPDRPPGSGTDTGLRNVRSRLAAVYEDEASLLAREKGDVYEAIVSVPIRS